MEKRNELDLTMNAYENHYNIVDAPDFKTIKDMPARIIYDELKKRIAVPCFGDYLKRYINKVQGLSEKQDVQYYVDTVVENFKARQTPSSFDGSSTTLKNAAKNWLAKRSVSRKTVFLLGFGLSMSVDDVNEMLEKALYEQEINPKDPFEVICRYCFQNGFDYLAYENLWEKYSELPADIDLDDFSEQATSNIKYSMTSIANEDMLFAYLATLKASVGISRFSRTAKREFDALYEKVKGIISRENEIALVDVSPSNVESYIYAGIPKTKDNNLVKDDMSEFKDVFVGKKLSRQRINQLIKGETEVTRNDIITLSFVVHADRIDVAPQKRYNDFYEETCEILNTCFMKGLIVQNPYENFVMACVLANDPMGTYWDVWESSYDWQEE